MGTTVMTLGDIAKLIGRPNGVVGMWVARGAHSLPAHFDTTTAGKIWWTKDIDEWCQDHPELIGEAWEITARARKERMSAGKPSDTPA